MLDSLSKWSIPLYGETSNQIWLGFFYEKGYLYGCFLADKFTCISPLFEKYYTIWIRIFNKTHTLTSCFCISLVLESRSRRKTGQYIYCCEFECRSWRGVQHYVTYCRWFSTQTLEFRQLDQETKVSRTREL
jgi:hypothetical protein